MILYWFSLFKFHDHELIVIINITGDDSIDIVHGEGLLDVLGERDAWHNIHGLQFLEEQLAGIGDLQRGDMARGLAEVAPEELEIVW